MIWYVALGSAIGGVARYLIGGCPAESGTVLHTGPFAHGLVQARARLTPVRARSEPEH
jgi:hypothetical protein